MLKAPAPPRVGVRLSTDRRRAAPGVAERVGPLQRPPDRNSSMIVATLRLLLFAIRTTRRNIVVAPGGVLGISSIVFHMLFCLLLSIAAPGVRSEEHTSELQSPCNLV